MQLKRVISLAKTVFILSVQFSLLPRIRSNEAIPRNALLIAGAVSRLPARKHATNAGQFSTAASLYDSTNRPHYSSVPICAASLRKHIIEANPAYWDIFLHSWNPDLEHVFRKAFPNSTSMVFEDNRPYEAAFAERYRNAKWPTVSFSISVGKVAMQMMQFQQQEMGGNEYSRVLLVRPDLLMVKSLHLNALPPGKIYCNSFGNAAGDFRFVMESKHVPNLVAALSPHESPSKWFVLGGHGNMRQFTLNVLRVPITGDAQLFAGEDEDVYRKIDWGAMQCSAPNWWRDFMKAEYGMKEDDWLAIWHAFSKPRCNAKAYQWGTYIMGHCCFNNTCSKVPVYLQPPRRTLMDRRRFCKDTETWVQKLTEVDALKQLPVKKSAKEGHSHRYH